MYELFAVNWPTCDDNRFNEDGIDNNGCEMGCPTVATVSCETCTSFSQCTCLTHDDNRFNDDGIDNSGCEIDCPTVALGSGGTGSSSSECTI